MSERLNPRGQGRMRYGPLKKPYRKNLESIHFGKLIVVEYDGLASDGTSMWYCRCNACGAYKSIRGASLLAGTTKTCGCASITHGFTRGERGCEKPTEYKSWCSAKGRCHSKTNQAYKFYGARGIVMCQGWQDDYASFFLDLGIKPKGTSLERKDVNGNYSCGHCEECVRKGWPMNCKWTTPKEQARNRRNTVFLEHNGKIKSLPEWADEMGWDTKRLWDRLYRYKMPIAIALSGVRTKTFIKVLTSSKQ